MATKTTVVELGTPSTMFFQRSNLKRAIIKHWVNTPTSNIGLMCGVLKDGVLKTNGWFRSDLACVQYGGLCNVFIEANGKASIQPFDGVGLTDQECADIRAYCVKEMLDNPAFFELEAGFVAWLHKNIKQMNGMTPEEAVAFISAAGY